jgi:DNA primase
MDMDNCSFKQAVDKLAHMVGVRVKLNAELAKGKTETVDWLKGQRKHVVYTDKDITDVVNLVNKSRRLKGHIKKSEYWKDMKFSNDIVDFFELGYYNNRIIIPIRNLDDTLVAYSSRSAETDPIKGRYLHKKGFSRRDVLYNYNNVVKLLEDGQCDMIMLTEGFSDVWRAFQHGFLKCVAIMGREVTPEQTELLLRYTYKVCLALDRDRAGMDGMRQFAKRAGHLVDIEWMAIPPHRDVGSLSKEEFWKYFNERKVIN